MTTTSDVVSPEKGTRVIPLQFLDEDGTVIALNQLITPIWSLTTRGGAQINSRTNVVLSALYVVLTGDDLAMFSGDPWRVVTVEARYNSATYGNNLYLKAQYEFEIEDLVKVT